MDFSAKGRRDRKSYVQHDLLYNVIEIFLKKGEKKVSCKKGVVLFFFICKLGFISYIEKRIGIVIWPIRSNHAAYWNCEVDIKMTGLHYPSFDKIKINFIFSRILRFVSFIHNSVQRGRKKTQASKF